MSASHSRTFHLYADDLLRHHSLLIAGIENGVDVEAIETEMSQLWGELEPGERIEIRGMSSDLNWIRRGFLPAPKGRRSDDVRFEELEELDRLSSEAKDDESAVRTLLHTLRLCLPALDPGFAALVFGRCYVGLDLRTFGEPFLKAAMALSRRRVGSHVPAAAAI